MFESELEIVDVNHNHDIRDQGRAFRMTVLNITINSMHKTILYISRQLLIFSSRISFFTTAERIIDAAYRSHILYQLPRYSLALHVINMVMQDFSILHSSLFLTPDSITIKFHLKNWLLFFHLKKNLFDMLRDFEIWQEKLSKILLLPSQPN